MVSDEILKEISISEGIKMAFCLNCRKNIEVASGDNNDQKPPIIQCDTCGIFWPNPYPERSIEKPALEAARLDKLIATLEPV